jgi:hypothetical protein
LAKQNGLEFTRHVRSVSGRWFGLADHEFLQGEVEQTPLGDDEPTNVLASGRMKKKTVMMKMMMKQQKRTVHEAEELSVCGTRIKYIFEKVN